MRGAKIVCKYLYWGIVGKWCASNYGNRNYFLAYLVACENTVRDTE